MKLRCLSVAAILILLFTLLPIPAFAQGGGASQTGTINGKVSDAQGGVLPGVTVTITGPALIVAQTAVTNETGMYRFPAVPPGRYSVVYDLTGFNKLTRENIDISIGFTATLNVELKIASLNESVTVTGDSPVIDTSATRVQQNFKLEALKSIPNARDMWALLAVTPAVQMGRIDVGGNRAGTQTAYTAFGYGHQDQQVQVLVEGINTTEGTGGAGIYGDYGAYEEVFVGTAGQGAEMPTPGVQSQFLSKSGGNQFKGNIYLDYENHNMEGSNIPAAFTAPTAFGGAPLLAGSNRIDRYNDFNIDGGGPIAKDKMWFYTSYRRQFNAVARPNFLFPETFDTSNWNLSGKGTYQLNKNNKVIAYYQWNDKVQPWRPWNDSYTYSTAQDTANEDSPTWIWKGEWNGTLSNNLYVEARYGVFGYAFPLVGYSDAPFIQDRSRLTSQGGDTRNQQDRDRKQVNGAATYFKDNFLGGTHSIRIGGELQLETQWNGYQRTRAGNVEQILNNGVPFQVVLGFPTASGEVGHKSDRDNLLSIGKLNTTSAFVSDQWTLGRVTLNLGARYDHYRSFIPVQQQLPYTNGPISLQAQTFPEQTFFVWNSVVPRVGMVYNITSDGKTVVKLNYGYFKHNPGPAIAQSANPNQSRKTVTYTWNDTNKDGLYENGEQGTLVSTALAGTVAVDPNITQPYTNEVAAFVERQLSGDIGVQGGFVYKTNDNLWQSYVPGRAPAAYTVPFAVADRGPDGALGTGDDQSLTFYGIPSAQLGSANTVIENTPGIGRYKSAEVSLNKRLSHHWSAGFGGSYSWIRENASSLASNSFASGLYPNSRNDALYTGDPANGTLSYTQWGFNAYGSYEAPFGIKISPVFRSQAGQSFGRTLSISAPSSCACFASGTVLVEPLDSRRMDNVNVFDIRTEKAFSLNASAKLRVFLDAFNLNDNHAAEVSKWATGATFLQPTAIVAPRVARVGVRFEW